VIEWPLDAGAEVSAVPLLPALTAMSDGDVVDAPPTFALPLAPVLVFEAPLVEPRPVPTLAEEAAFVLVPTDARCEFVAPTVPVAVAVVGQFVPVDALAIGSWPLRAIAVPAPASANAATEASMDVRNDDIGSSLMGSGTSEPFTPYIEEHP
jgi:hypothetical protein